MFTKDRSIRRAAPVWVVALVIAASLGGAASAAASTIEVSASPSPTTAGVQVTLTNTGMRDNPLLSALVYDYYEPNTAPCAATAAAARERSHGAGYIATLELPETVAFSVQTFLVPVRGATAYRVCAFLVSGGNDSATPDAVGSTVLQIPLTHAQLLARALKKCQRTHNRLRRASCIKTARKHYGPTGVPTTPHGQGASAR